MKSGMMCQRWFGNCFKVNGSKRYERGSFKVEWKANKKVVVTYKVGGSFVSSEILDVLRREIIKNLITFIL